MLGLLSGCAVFLPTPSHQVVIEIENDVSNRQLTEQLLVILDKERLTGCEGVVDRSADLPDCAINWWQGKLTVIDPDNAIIEIGDFPAYATNTIGHSARLKRISAKRLQITVKGIFIYYSDLPNDDVARELAAIIHAGL